MYFKFVLMKIDQIVAGISTFEVPGSKWNILLPGTSLLPGTLYLLPAGDVGGKINDQNLNVSLL